MISNDVKKIIKDANIDGIDSDRIYSYAVPKSLQSQLLNKIVILITDISYRPNKFGSDKIIGRKGSVQVQFFYPTTIEDDVTTKYEIPIVDILRDNDWYQTIGGGVDREPTTQQLYTTYHFEKIIKS